MVKVIWAPSAIEDVEQIADFIARDSPDRASLFVTRIEEAVDQLGDFPKSGRTIPEIGDPGYREVLLGDYRIMYRLVGEEVWITGVVHGSRDWRP